MCCYQTSMLLVALGMYVCENVEQQRKERGVKKGHTWNELNNEGAYEIVVDDQRHTLR